MGFHGGAGSPGENLRRAQRAMGLGCGAHASLRGKLGLAADLGVGAQPAEKLSAPDFSYAEAEIAQKDLRLLATQFENDPFQTHSPTGTHRQTSRLLGAALLGSSTSAKMDRIHRGQTQIRRLNDKFIVGLGLKILENKRSKIEARNPKSETMQISKRSNEFK